MSASEAVPYTHVQLFDLYDTDHLLQVRRELSEALKQTTLADSAVHPDGSRMKLGELRRRARAEGHSEEEVDEALDSDDPAASLVAMISSGRATRVGTPELVCIPCTSPEEEDDGLLSCPICCERRPPNAFYGGATGVPTACGCRMGVCLHCVHENVHRDHDLHSISASFIYDGGHFFNRCAPRSSRAPCPRASSVSRRSQSRSSPRCSRTSARSAAATRRRPTPGALSCCLRDVATTIASAQTASASTSSPSSTRAGCHAAPAPPSAATCSSCRP